MDEIKQMEFNISRILDCGFMIEEAVTGFQQVDIGYGMKLVYSIEESWVQIGIRTDFRQTGTGIIFLSGTVLTRFGIRELKNFLDADGVVDFPKNSLETLFSIAFGHMRAILAKNCAGSRYSSIIVPVINPFTLFHDLYKDNVATTSQHFDSIGYNVEGKKAIEILDVNFGNESFIINDPNVRDTRLSDDTNEKSKKKIKKV